MSEKSQKLNSINPLNFFGKNSTRNALNGENNNSETQNNKYESHFKIIDLSKHKVKTKGADVVNKLKSFSALKNIAPDFVLDNLIELEHLKPTPVQSFAIPVLLSKRDLFGIAPTGSGKTAAFLIPAITLCINKKIKKVKNLEKIKNQTEKSAKNNQNIYKKDSKTELDKNKETPINIEKNRKKIKNRPISKNFPLVLILTPTRELAKQIYATTLTLIKSEKLKAATIETIKNTKKPHILISTPFQLYSNIKTGKINLNKVEYLVLDEADQLLDKEEERKEKYYEKKRGKISKKKKVHVSAQIEKILNECNNENLQRSLFSATLPTHIEEFGRQILKNPVRLTVGVRNGSTENVEQSLVFTGTDQSKLFALKQTIEKYPKPPILVFVQSKSRAKELNDELVSRDFKSDYITSERSAPDRDYVLKKFISGEISILICSGLLSRGIDFQRVELVVNFDFPQSTTDYVHRVGRTGRAGRKGRAVTFFTESDRFLLKNVSEVIKDAGGDVSEWILKAKPVRFGKIWHNFKSFRTFLL